jgi:hypothetical protein
MISTTDGHRSRRGGTDFYRRKRRERRGEPLELKIRNPPVLRSSTAEGGESETNPNEGKRRKGEGAYEETTKESKPRGENVAWVARGRKIRWQAGGAALEPGSSPGQ